MSRQHTVKVATWNINGVKARLESVKTWLREAEPDVACLQEIKSVTEQFPAAEFEDLGYNVHAHGQKGFNGVAILSKAPLDDVMAGLPGDDDDAQARYLEASVPLGETVVRVASIYLPNGNPLGGDKFTYKIDWMARLKSRARDLLAWDVPVALIGDYNVIPQPDDAKNPDAWTDDALFQPASRDAFYEICHLGYTDAVRLTTASADVFTFWDYQGGAWQKDHGIRIDHALLNAQAVDRLESVGVDKHVRAWEKPSDHVPVWFELTERA